MTTATQNASHTPGPWRVIGDEVGRTDFGEPYAAVQTSEDAIDIIAPGSMADAHLANARLIAAAPDLLAACELARELIETGLCEGGERAVIAALRAAHAKATRTT